MFSNKYKLFVMVGPSGSGKSPEAEKIAKKYQAEIVVLDEIERIFPVMQNKQVREEKVLSRFCNKIREILEQKRNVVADAANISMYSRRRILNTVKGLQLEKICCLMVKTYEDCIRDSKKERGIIEKQIRKFEIPFKGEGWDRIKVYDVSERKYSFGELKLQMEGFDQKNPHHDRDLLFHCNYVAELYKAECERIDNKKFGDFAGNIAFHIGAQLHDIGKLYCQTIDENGIGHYYQHHCIGAYYILTHLERKGEFAKDDTMLKCCFLVNYHMFPFMWKNEKINVRWKERFGEYNYQMLILFHLCDIKRDGII